MTFIMYIPGIRNILPDSWYVKCQYRYRMGKKLNLKDPKEFSEKIQWLKLYYHKPEYKIMSDKYAAKTWIVDRLKEEFSEAEKYIPKTYGCWGSFDEIDFTKLPDKFVLKMNHDSGTVLLVTDKKEFDIIKAKKHLETAMKKKYYWLAREWCYKNITPCIFAEEYLGENLTDYKFHCFDKARFVQVISDRHINKKNNMYTLPEWVFEPTNIDASGGFKVGPDIFPRPEKLDEMIRICERLSSDVPYLRVDLYYINNNIYIGELTAYPAAGYIASFPDRSTEFGGWINLPKDKK